MKIASHVLVRELEGKRTLGREEDNIKIYVRCEGVDGNHLAQDRGQWRVINLLLP